MFRNKELRQFAFLFIFMSVIAAVLGFLINTAAGILTLVSVMVFGTMFYVFTRARYKNIAGLSEQIDLVLHNAERLFIHEGSEGELSVLSSEITKMTQRIREQNDALKKEKEHLADSLADIAHQLRTPLTSVNLILTLLADNTHENQRKDFLREAEELLGQMDWLLTSLLKISRLDAGIVVFKSEQTDVNALINLALRPLLIPMELHNVHLQTDVPNGVRISCDAGWLSEAMQNILKNCIENAGDNGKIEIICKDNPLFTEIAIHDSGTGFDKEDIRHVFDRFYRGENKDASGYGIGLALCRMIITRQGGTVTAKNHPMGGAVFEIRFPK